jgi:protein SCO1
MQRVRKTAGRAARLVGAFIEDGRFAVFMLAALLLWNGLMLALVAIPPQGGVIGEFASEFRKWCFRYDATTDTIDWTFTIPFFTVPFVLGAATVAVYYRQLGRVLRKPRTLSACVAGAVLVVGMAGVGLVWVSDAMPPIAQAHEPGVTPPFPADTLRTAYTPPEFNLTNQLGEPVSMRQYRGKVVVMTGVYASCPHT